MNTIYDVIIIGGGPAGYTSALYTARAGLNTLVIERFSAGGQMTQTSRIDNYPGFDEGVDGFTLGMKMQSAAQKFGAKTEQTEVKSVKLSDSVKTVSTADGEFYGKCIIIATGAEHKHLGLKDEEALIGRGVGYCAACDGMFFKDKTVSVIGGGNSAAADALLLSKICKKIYLVHRRDSLRAEKFYHEQLMKKDNVEFLWNCVATEFLHDTKISGLKIKNLIDNTEKEVKVDGVFISIGRVAKTDLIEGQLDIDEEGYIKADETTKTGVDGVFAVGDVRTKPVRQIVTAVADGATAAHFAQEYLEKNK